MTRYKVSAKNNNKYSMKFRELLIEKIEQLKIKPTELSEISGVPKTCIYNFRYRISATSIILRNRSIWQRQNV